MKYGFHQQRKSQVRGPCSDAPSEPMSHEVRLHINTNMSAAQLRGQKSKWDWVLVRLNGHNVSALSQF
jgi:hypothetical protein